MDSWKSLHCGHFISRRYEATRYDEMNCAPQCVSCNTFHQGRQFEFGLWIDKTYGHGTADTILALSRKIMKRTQFDYEVIAEYYKKKLNDFF